MLFVSCSGLGGRCRFRLGGRLVKGASPAVLCGCRAGTGNLGSLGAKLDAVGVSEFASGGGFIMPRRSG